MVAPRDDYSHQCGKEEIMQSVTEKYYEEFQKISVKQLSGISDELIQQLEILKKKKNSK